MNYKIDHNRKERIGFPEVVYGEAKDVDTLVNIINEILKHRKKVLITKLQEQKAVEIKKQYKNVFYDFKSGICIVGDNAKS